MDQTKSYFVYSPPKSNSHGHAVRDKNIKRATQKAIEAFVSNFNARTDNNVQLTLYYDKKNELQKAIKTIEKLNAFLGPAKHDWDNTNPLFAQIPNSVTWESNTINMLDMLDYINQLTVKIFFHYLTIGSVVLIIMESPQNLMATLCIQLSKEDFS